MTTLVYDNVQDDKAGHLYYPGAPASWVWLLSKEKAAELQAWNQAVTVTSRDQRFLIPQYQAFCLSDFTQIVDKFRARESPGFISCFFRGQTRDYFDEAGSLGCLPSGYRNAKWLNRYKGMWFDEMGHLVDDGAQLEKELAVWEKILVGEFGVNVASQLGFERKPEKIEGGYLLSSYVDTSPRASISTNIMLLSICQHYGFPTPSLDVTSDPLVALWFALHTCRASRGKFRYETVTPLVGPRPKGPPQEQADIPSVLIFLQNPRFSAVNVLTSVKTLEGVAHRPFRQKAVLLPFASHSVTPVGLPLPPAVPKEIGSLPSLVAARALGVDEIVTWTDRIPAAMIKICFSEKELRTASSELTAEYLFPTDEPLYARLLSSKAPNLAVYLRSRV